MSVDDVIILLYCIIMCLSLGPAESMRSQLGWGRQPGMPLLLPTTTVNLIIAVQRLTPTHRRDLVPPSSWYDATVDVNGMVTQTAIVREYYPNLHTHSNRADESNQ